MVNRYFTEDRKVFDNFQKVSFDILIRFGMKRQPAAYL